MKELFIILVVLIVAGCSSSKVTYLDIQSDKVNKIEVYKGFPGEQIAMKKDFENNLLTDLNKSTKDSPRKFMKPYRILVYYNNGIIDTLRTNGTLHINNDNDYYQISENLIDKYKK